MGMVESDIEIMLNERDIKTFAVVADNNFVFLDILKEIIHEIIEAGFCPGSLYYRF